MMALSLMQPWASLVIEGVKKIETRSWQTLHRGEILIHASTRKAAAEFGSNPKVQKYVGPFQSLPFGCMIGTVFIDDIIPVNDINPSIVESLSLEEKMFGDYSEGRFAWMLSRPVKFQQPIPARGMMRLWNYNLY